MNPTSLFPVAPKPAGPSTPGGLSHRAPPREPRGGSDMPTPPAREPRRFDTHERPAEATTRGGRPEAATSNDGGKVEGTERGKMTGEGAADAGEMATGFNEPGEAELLELHGLEVVEPLMPGDLDAALSGGSGMAGMKVANVPAAEPTQPMVAAPTNGQMRPQMIEQPKDVAQTPAMASGSVRTLDDGPVLIDTPLPTQPNVWPDPDGPMPEHPPMPAWPTDGEPTMPMPDAPVIPWSGAGTQGEVDPTAQVVPAPLPVAPRQGPNANAPAPQTAASSAPMAMADTFASASTTPAPSATVLQEVPPSDGQVPKAVVDRALAEVAGMADKPEADTLRSTMPGLDMEAKPATERADRPTVTADARQRFVSDNAANLVKQIKTATVKSGGEMQIRLDPPNLGSVAVRVSVVAGSAEVSMVTPSGEAAQLLGRSLQQLKTSLEAAGIQVERMQVRQALPADQGQQQQGTRDENQDERQARRQTDDRQQQGRRQQREDEQP